MKHTEAQVDAVIVFAASMLVYLATICPTIAAGDSGDLITAAYTLGVAHPAGYPLYVLLGKLFTLIPYGSIAFRVNLLSAVAAAAAAVVCHLAVRLLMKNRAASVGAGLAVAYSQQLWNQALIAEAYSLNAFFVAVLVYLAVLWSRRRNVKHLYWMAFAFGLGLTNHVSLVFYLPAFAYFVYFTDRKVLSGRVAGRVVLFAAAGLLLYAYIPLRASMDPAYNWGDPHTIERFVNHVTGYIHRRLYAYPSAEVNVAARVAGVISLLLRQYSLVWLLAALGFESMKKEKRLLALTLLIGAIDLVYSVFLNTVSLEITAFEIPTAVAASVWIGFGLEKLLTQVGAKKNPAVGHAAVAAVAVIMLASGYGSNNYRDNLIAYDYGMDILNTLDENAVIFVDGDNNILPLYYLHYAEGVRPDVTVIERIGFLSHGVYGNDYLFLPESEHERRQNEVEGKYIESGRPVYYSVKRDMEAFPGKAVVQTGLAFRVVDVNESVETEKYWSLYTLRGSEDPSVSKDYMTRDIIATYHIRKGEYYFRKNMTLEAVAEFTKASSENQDNPTVHYVLGNIYLNTRMPDKAAYELENAVALTPDDPKAHNNLGYAYVMLGRREDAKLEYEKTLQLDPTYTKARFNLAGMLLESGKIAEALSEYSTIIRQDPKYSSAYRNVGGIYYNLGVATNKTEYKKKAALFWKKYVELSPASPDAPAIAKKVAEIDSLGPTTQAP